MTLGSCSKPLMTYYQDYDGDKYGDKNVASPPSCSPPIGYVAISGDCDDHNANWYPGTTACNLNVDPNSLITCNSDGANSTRTCPNGCVGGQCRSFTTVNVSGSVTCGTLVCPATQGCGFPSVGNQLPTCGQGTSGYYELCDGPTDCPGQVCCHIMFAGTTEHR